MSPVPENAIARLTDQQALWIVQSLAGEFAQDDLPQDTAGQAQALNSAFAKLGQGTDALTIASADAAEAGPAARKLLDLMHRVPDLRPSLDAWLANPPRQESAALPIALAAPVVLTGCLVLLQVAGHMFIERTPAGKWHVSYDPARETKLDNTMSEIVRTLADLIWKMAPGRA